MEKVFVIKIGGNIIDNEKELQSFLADFAAVKERKILVHGGGKIASKIGGQLGINPRYINGRRITDDATIELVTMVYGGLINKKIIAQLQANQCNAIGLTGADGNIIPAVKRPVTETDFGWVGDIKSAGINSANLQSLLAAGFVPVFAPLTHDGHGHILNTNADTIASTLSISLSSFYTVRLIYCFEKKGILDNVNDDNSVIAKIDRQHYQEMLSAGKLFEGILPKIDNAFAAVNAGVKEVVVGDAKNLLQNTTETTLGTLFIQ